MTLGPLSARHPEVAALLLARPSKGDGPRIGAAHPSRLPRLKRPGSHLRMTDRGFVLLATAISLWPTAVSAQTVEEFYRGRSITMLVGGGAGGGYDTYARIFARHMAKHIPGNPTIIAKNM